MTTVTTPPLSWRVRRVLCELDDHGEIDSHAALCLRLAIDATRPATTEMILVDLRDLTTITTAGLALFARHNAACHARGMELGLLVSAHERHHRIAEAFVLGGLGDTLRYTHERDPPARTARPVRLLDHARTVRRGRLARAARRYSPRRPRNAPTSQPRSVMRTPPR